MPQTNYIPTREPELVPWVNNLNEKLADEPGDYGQTADSIAPFVAAHGAFVAAYAKANDPSTRTSANIADKNTKKKAMLDAVRPLVQTIQNWPGMTNQKRDLLEIPVRDQDPTPIGPPEEMPILRVARVTGRVLDLEVRSVTPNGNKETRRKPVGVRAVWLRTHVGENPPAVLDQWQFRGGSTKSNPQIVFGPEVAPGTPVWVTAQWVNPTDVPGPACAPVKAHISFQGLSEAA